MVLSPKYLNIFVKLGSNDILLIETLGIGAHLANLTVILSGYANYSENLAFSTYMT